MLFRRVGIPTGDGLILGLPGLIRSLLPYYNIRLFTPGSGVDRTTGVNWCKKKRNKTASHAPRLQMLNWEFKDQNRSKKERKACVNFMNEFIRTAQSRKITMEFRWKQIRKLLEFMQRRKDQEDSYARPGTMAETAAFVVFVSLKGEWGLSAFRKSYCFGRFRAWNDFGYRAIERPESLFGL